MNVEQNKCVYMSGHRGAANLCLSASAIYLKYVYLLSGQST